MSRKPFFDESGYGDIHNQFIQRFSKSGAYSLPEMLAQREDLLCQLSKVIETIERPSFDDNFNKFIVREAKMAIERIKAGKA